MLALAYSVVNPLGEAPDEADHWAYIVHLARERELPVGPKRTQSKHPPLYHISAALAASLAEPTNNFLRSNPDVEFTPRAGWSPNSFIHTTVRLALARRGSRLSPGAALVGFPEHADGRCCLSPGAQSLPGWPTVAFGATAVLAFLPEFAFIGGSTNNDNAAALFGTLALWGMFALWRGAGRFRAGWWTPLALGLGLLSKASTLSLWPVVGLAIVMGAAAGQTNERGESWSPTFGRPRLFCAACFLPGAPG